MCDQPYQPDTQQHTLRDRIAAVLVDHAAAEYSWGVDGCECGFKTSDLMEQAAHQADAVVAALGLRQEYDPYSEPESSRHRYVTEWTTDD